ncbi:MAG: alpha/beta hydrolase, partial [Myxococcota bacterium]
VAGHSMGGGVALRHALLADASPPDAYVLLAPNFGEGPTERAPPEGPQDPSPYVHFDVTRMIGQLMLSSVGVTWFDGLPILYFNDPHDVKAYSFRAVMSAQPTRPHTADAALASIDAPLLVVVGQDDEVFDAAAYPDFVATHGDGRTVVLPGVNHQGVLESTETWSVVGAWFEGLGQPS